MTTERKRLFRELIYWAMVDMRAHAASGGILQRFWHWRKRGRALAFTVELNNWLHNVALYSAHDFQGFDEKLFWRDYQYFRHKFPADKWAGLAEMVVKELQKQL